MGNLIEGKVVCTENNSTIWKDYMDSEAWRLPGQAGRDPRHMVDAKRAQIQHLHDFEEFG